LQLIATDINHLKTMMPEPYEPLASTFEHDGILYCLVSKPERQCFQASIPAAIYDADNRAFVIPAVHSQASVAQQSISDRNEYGSCNDVWADTCKPAFGTLKTLVGHRQRGILEFMNGHVYRSIWHNDGKTVFMPANAPEALIYMQVTGIRDDIYLSNFEADLAAFWQTIGSIRSWTRKDGIPMLSRLANNAVMRLQGWYYFKRNQAVVDTVQDAIRELSWSLPSTRKSNAMIGDHYGNEAFEMADIFNYFSQKSIGGYPISNSRK